MSTVVLHGHPFKVKITSAEIKKAVVEVAKQINKDYQNKKPLFLAVLNGSFIFAANLMENMEIDCEISFVKLASYEGDKSTGNIKKLIGINENLEGRDVIVLEDIVDSGATIENVLEQLKDLGAASIKIASLLFKPDAYTKDVVIDYNAIVVPNDFLVGYGLDYYGLGRNLNDIYVLDYEAEDKVKFKVNKEGV